MDPFGRVSGSRTGYPRCCQTIRAGYGRAVLALLSWNVSPTHWPDHLYDDGSA